VGFFLQRKRESIRGSQKEIQSKQKNTSFSYQPTAINREAFLKYVNDTNEQCESCLNYSEFENDFYFEAFEDVTVDDLILNIKQLFIEKVNHLILSSELESTSKIYLKNILKCLKETVSDLAILYNNKNTNKI
jgi:hypothetical protein